MDTKKINVGVFFGGKSPEHEISIITALQVMENFDKEKFEIVPVYVSKSGQWFCDEILKKIETFKDLNTIDEKTNTVMFAPNSHALRLSKKSLFDKEKFFSLDIIFNCFHGGIGEAGGFAGIFEAFDIPYVGTGISGGVLSMDKVVMKQLFEANGLPITKWVWFYRNEFQSNKSKALKKIEELKYPLFVKPANGGSTIGVTKVKEKKDLESALEVAMVFDSKIIVEESFENASEINVSVLGNTGFDLMTSVCEEVVASVDGVLTYDDKYKNNGKKSSGMASTKRIIPANIPNAIEKEIKKVASSAFEILNCSGVSRVDFLYNRKTNKIVILEVNNPPGSLAFYLWEKSGLTFQNLLTKLIDLGFEKYNDQKKNITTFPTNVLENLQLGGAKSK